MTELAKRSLVALFGIPILLFVIYMGGIVFSIALTIISSMALWEFYKMAEKKNAFPYKKWGIVVNILIFFFCYYFYNNFINFDYNLFIGSILFLLILFILQLFNNKNNSILNLSTTIFGIVYISLFLFCLFIIREYKYFFINSLYFNSQQLVFTIIISIWICDTAAYLIGSRFGKHKLMPSISPKKSIEGALAGFFGALLTVMTIHHFTLNFNLIHSIAIGSIIGIFGQIGDLFESQLKRDAGVKDSSDILPGHGGFLDRFDSILFVSPILLLYLMVFN